jgi:hypothetical protein
LNGLTLILVKKLLKFGYSVGHCGAEALTRGLVILNGCPTGLEPSMSLKCSCTVHVFQSVNFSIGFDRFLTLTDSSK